MRTPRGRKLFRLGAIGAAALVTLGGVPTASSAPAPARRDVMFVGNNWDGTVDLVNAEVGKYQRIDVVPDLQQRLARDDPGRARRDASHPQHRRRRARPTRRRHRGVAGRAHHVRLADQPRRRVRLRARHRSAGLAHRRERVPVRPHGSVAGRLPVGGLGDHCQPGRHARPGHRHRGPQLSDRRFPAREQVFRGRPDAVQRHHWPGDHARPVADHCGHLDHGHHRCD